MIFLTLGRLFRLLQLFDDLFTDRKDSWRNLARAAQNVFNPKKAEQNKIATSVVREKEVIYKKGVTTLRLRT